MAKLYCQNCGRIEPKGDRAVNQFGWCVPQYKCPNCKEDEMQLLKEDLEIGDDGGIKPIDGTEKIKHDLKRMLRRGRR